MELLPELQDLADNLEWLRIMDEDLRDDRALDFLCARDWFRLWHAIVNWLTFMIQLLFIYIVLYSVVEYFFPM